MKSRSVFGFSCRAMSIAILAMFLVGCGAESKPEDRTFELAISGGALEPDLVEVKQGDRLTLDIDSDQEGTFHVHGYNEMVDLDHDGTGKLQFTTDATGRFSLVLHLFAEEESDDKKGEHEGEKMEGGHDDDDEKKESEHEMGDHGDDEAVITLGTLEVQPR